MFVHDEMNISNRGYKSKYLSMLFSWVEEQACPKVASIAVVRKKERERESG